MKKPKVVSLFSGAGGLDIGFKKGRVHRQIKHGQEQQRGDGNKNLFSE